MYIERYNTIVVYTKPAMMFSKNERTKRWLCDQVTLLTTDHWLLHKNNTSNFAALEKNGL